MPLRIHVQPSRHVHRPGEPFRALVELSNEDRETVYVLEGLSVRCHGVEACDPNWISSNYHAAVKAMRDGKRVVRTLFSAKVGQMLERFVFLAPGQEKQFHVGYQLPEKLPPSFKGTAVRYVYELIVEARYRQAACNERSLLKKSFESQAPRSISQRRSFVVFPDYLDATQMNNKVLDEGPSNEVPLLEIEFQTEATAMQWSEVTDEDRTSSTEGSRNVSDGESNWTMRKGTMSGELTDSRSISRFSLPETEISYAPPVRRRTSSLTHAETQMLLGTCVKPQMFNLRFGDQTIVLFSFNPSMSLPLRLGGTIGGVLHLSETDDKWRCRSYSVGLETEEEIRGAYRPNGKERNVRKLHCEHSEYVGDALVTSFVFSIPSSAPPSFRTPLMELRWILKFEFDVGRPVDWNENGDVPTSPPDSEPLVWHLPLTVYPL